MPKSDLSDLFTVSVSRSDLGMVVAALGLLQASHERKAHTGDVELDSVYAKRAAAASALALSLSSLELPNA